MSFKRPRVPKPKIPKLRKPATSGRKKLKKAIKSEVSKKITSKTIKKKTSYLKPKPTSHKKTTHKIRGICYSEKNCKGKIILKQCTKPECENKGGKSWKGLRGCQEI